MNSPSGSMRIASPGSMTTVSIPTVLAKELQDLFPIPLHHTIQVLLTHYLNTRGDGRTRKSLSQSNTPTTIKSVVSSSSSPITQQSRQQQQQVQAIHTRSRTSPVARKPATDSSPPVSSRRSVQPTGDTPRRTSSTFQRQSSASPSSKTPTREDHPRTTTPNSGRKRDTPSNIRNSPATNWSDRVVARIVKNVGDNNDTNTNNATTENTPRRSLSAPRLSASTPKTPQQSKGEGRPTGQSTNTLHSLRVYSCSQDGRLEGVYATVIDRHVEFSFTQFPMHLHEVILEVPERERGPQQYEVLAMSDKGTEWTKLLKGSLAHVEGGTHILKVGAGSSVEDSLLVRKVRIEFHAGAGGQNVHLKDVKIVTFM